MFPSDPKITNGQSTTFRELILLPRRTTLRSALPEVSLSTKIAENFPLAIPFMSSAMESVTGEQLAVALALQGGLGVIPAGKVELVEQLKMIEAVKAYHDGVVEEFVAVSLHDPLRRVDELEQRHGYTSFPVVDGEGKLQGEVSTRDYHPERDLERTVVTRMRALDSLLVCREGQPFDEAREMLLTSAFNRAYQVDEQGVLRRVLFRSGIKREARFKEARRDEKGRLAVAAAISTHPEDVGRAEACVQSGADLLSIDASDGFSDFMRDTLAAVKPLGVPVVAGNVVDRDGFEFLAECGADAVKVGIGSGSICTTRRVKAIGRGQATALREVVLARDIWFQRTGRYLPVISDGGVSGTGDMSVALALGADVLMMGKYFAGFRESPTVPYAKKFQVGGGLELTMTVKPYWGEASARAKNVRRYQQNDPRTFVIEGEEGWVVCKGSIHDLLPTDLKAIKGTLSSCGCADLEEFRREVTLERQSIGSQQEGGISIFQG